MSEESSTDAPGTAAGEGEPVSAQEEPPPRSRRTALVLRCAAVLSVALIAVAVVWSVAYPLAGSKYSHLPQMWQGPVYASPDDACTLIRASTLATYLPSATVGLGYRVNCIWNGVNGSPALGLAVSIWRDPDSAQGGFQYNVQSFVQYAHHRYKFYGAQPVNYLGERATAVFVTALGYPTVALFVVSGNAEIVLTFSPRPPGAPPLSRAAMLAADIVMAREVLADLPG